MGLSKNFIKYYQVILGVGWLILQIYFWHSLNVKIVYDSHRFIDLANFILHKGTVPVFHATRYLGYSLFIASIFKLGGTFQTIIIIQIILSGLALSALYQIVLCLTQSELTALITVSLFILWAELSAWNFYLMTESLFISCPILALYGLLHSKNSWLYIICILLFLFILILRPNGFIFSVAAFAYLTVQLWQKYPYWRRWFIFTGAFLLILVVLLLDKYLLRTFDILGVYQRGDIIFGYSGIIIKPDLKPVTITSSPILNIIIFVFENAAYFFKAGFLKVFYLSAHIKPYFSIIHNVYIIAFLYPLYFFAFRTKGANHPAYFFFYTIIGLQTIMVFFTTEDWDGRFLTTILPYIFILSAKGMVARFKLAKWEKTT